MKKLCTLITVILTLCFALSGCGNNNNSSAGKSEFAISGGESIAVEVGTTYNLTADNAEGEITWSSSDPKTAVVTKIGLVRALKPGKATVTATCGNKTDSVEIVSYSLSLPSHLYVKAGEQKDIDLTTAGLDGETVTYTCDNENVAKISDLGGISALKKGYARVSVKVDKYNIEKKCDLKVYEEIGEFDLSEENVNYYGRVLKKDSGVTFYNTMSGFEVSFIGTSLTANFIGTQGLKLRVYVDGDTEGYTIPSLSTTEICSGLSDGPHTVKVVRANYELRGALTLTALSGADSFITPDKKPDLKFEFYGDSITAGYGVNADGTTDTISNEDGTVTYAALTAQYFNAQASALCYSGVSVAVPMWLDWLVSDRYGEYTYTINRDKWDFSSYQADYVVVNLGTNDAGGIASGKGDKQTFIDTYTEFLLNLRAKHPNAKIIAVYGMMGEDETVSDGIRQAVRAAGDNVYYLKMNRVSCNGYNGHPDIEGQKNGAKQLIEFIESL